MSALFRARKGGVTDRPVSAGSLSVPVAEPGAYLTDEVFLYRVVGLVASTWGDVVELEDCYWLDSVRVPLRDLSAHRLRVVTPGG